MWKQWGRGLPRLETPKASRPRTADRLIGSRSGTSLSTGPPGPLFTQGHVPQGARLLLSTLLIRSFDDACSARLAGLSLLKVDPGDPDLDASLDFRVMLALVRSKGTPYPFELSSTNVP